MIEEEPTIKYFNINFNLKRQPNVAQVLKGFVQEAIRTTKQEKIKFIASNRTTTPSPTPITRMSQYPETELKHKQFFQHHLNNRRTHITVWYSVITTLDIHKFKNRMMPYVLDKNIWMSSDEIEAGSNKTVAWLLHGHTSLLSKSLLATQLDTCLRECADSKKLVGREHDTD